jgi:uncharacterized membrane protein YheB (UPF0754 family)
MAAIWLQYLTIPLLAAIVGWGTNVVALKMTFYPLEFVGIPPWLGWQGIIPSKSRKMSNKAVDLITEKLVSPPEVIDRLEADRLVEEMDEEVAAMIREIIDEVAQNYSPKLWGSLPESVKEEVYARAQEDAPAVIRESLEDIKWEIEDLLDLKALAVEALMEDKELLNRIFLECGEEEFQFIERSGLYFGFGFGLVQAALWYSFQASFLLPGIGFVVGCATNFLALKMIFEPTEPRKIGPFNWQGLFLKRQDEVAEAYAELVANNVVTTQNLMKGILEGPTTDRLIEIVERHLGHAAEDYDTPGSPIFKWVVGSEEYEEMKEDVVDRVLEHLDRPIYEVSDYVDEALALEATLRRRLEALEPKEFEGLLRPVFQEDEWKLILVGAALGMAVGFVQLFVVFA